MCAGNTTESSHGQGEQQRSRGSQQGKGGEMLTLWRQLVGGRCRASVASVRSQQFNQSVMLEVWAPSICKETAFGRLEQDSKQ